MPHRRRWVRAGILSATLLLPAVASAATDAVTQAQARVSAASTLMKLPASLKPTLQSFQTPDATNNFAYSYGATCSPWKTPALATTPSPCWLGDSTGTRTIVLYGDSHAGSWIPAMANVATALHVKLAVFWFASCSTPFVTVSATGPFTSNRVDDCNKWHTTVASAIAAVHPFAIVQASGLGTAHAFTATQYNAWMAGWTQLGNQLKAKAPTAQRYLLSSTPYLKMPVPQCLAAHTTSVKSCAFTNVPSTGTTYGFSLENNLARDTQAATAMSAKLVNVVPLVCVKNVCPAVIGSSMVYADTDHFTVQINNDLSAALGLLLARAGLK